ncbi:hypothetical protein PSPO01_10899 [Paraphaeosphaeria sporulosa]
MVFLLCGIAYHIVRTTAIPLTFSINQTSTLPTNNQTVLQHEFAQSWVGASPVRSTWEILYACLAALVTSFSSFVQLNPPAYQERWQSVFLRKAKWVIITILIPEAAVLMAWLQWRRAVTLQKSLVPDRHSRRKNTRSRVVVWTTDMHNTIDRMTLTPVAIRTLAELGVFVDVHTTQITDLQRVDVLGRTVAVWQLTWLLITVLGRRVQNLPISLLELNTAVNVAFAMCLPLMWWRNPNNISHPLTVLEDKPSRSIAAMMLMATSMTKNIVIELGHESVDPRGMIELDYLCLAGDDSPLSNELVQKTADPVIASVYSPVFGVSPISVDQWDPHLLFAPCRKLFTSGAQIALSAKDLRRWSMASLALRSPTRVGITLPTQGSNVQETAGRFRHCLVDRARNLEFDSHYRDNVDGRVFVYMAVVLVLHGALHLTAWNWVFPTPIEKLFWRVSCFGLIGGFVIVVPVGRFTEYIYGRGLAWQTEKTGFLNQGVVVLLRIIRQVTRISAVLLGGFLAACSIYLFLASFPALRRSPSGVYARLEWSSYLPVLS